MVEIRERMATFGASVLTDAEVVSLIIGPSADSELGRRVLDVVGTPHGLLTKRLHELSVIKGIGTCRAQRLMAALELGRRASQMVDKGKPLSTAADVADRLARLKSEPIESFVAISVNSRNRVQGEWVVATGWESGVNLTPRQVFVLLTKEGASRVLLAHNHPSGDPTPSPEDVRFTQRLIEAARTLDIRVLDHVIVASGGYSSIRETARGELEFG
jgi:DNA repair protein RadC